MDKLSADYTQHAWRHARSRTICRFGREISSNYAYRIQCPLFTDPSLSYLSAHVRTPPSYAAWPAGGGALGALIRTHDWAATPLGPVENWPPALRTVVDLVVHSPLPMTVLWGPDQVQVYNDSYATLCGPRHPHALGRPQRATWPELQDFVGPVHQAVLQGETRSYIRQRLVLERSGAPEEAWFDLSYSPVHHEGRVRGLVVTVIDVTADVHTTEALLLNEERFHTYAGTGIVYRMNADWSELRQAALLGLGDRLRLVNNADEAATIASEVVGETLGVTQAGFGRINAVASSTRVVRDWRAGPDVPAMVGMHSFRNYGNYYADLRRGEVVAIADVGTDPRTAGKWDAFRALDVRALLNVPVLDASGAVGVFLAQQNQPRSWAADEIAFVRGVADRTWAEMARIDAAKALRALNMQLEQLAEDSAVERDRMWRLSGDIMLVARAEGRIAAVNPAWRATLGWNEEQLVGANLFDLVHPDDLAPTQAAMTTLEGDGRLAPNFQNRYRHRDGGYRWIAWNASRGDDGLIVAVGRDVTLEREHAAVLIDTEEKLRQSLKMEAVGQLTGSLAHDFNNLLASIGGSLELLALRVRNNKLDDLDRFVGIAQGAVRRAAALTHRLLAFSRRQPLDARPLDPATLVDGMLDLVRRTIGPAIRLSVERDPGLWTIMVDPNQLENALLNLCINARDAMPDGGRLRIVLANTVLDADQGARRELAAGDYVALDVIDTGTGMAPDVMTKAFDPFFTTKPIGQGTGLGLSMIYGFVRQSGGHVSAESVPGEGTVMRILLPRHQGSTDALPAPATDAERPAAAAARILLVDDEAPLRGLMAEALGQLGHRVVQAGDAATALRLLGTGAAVDLMVTDIGLAGGMNGRQLAEAACLARPGLKVLFITGYAEARLVEHGSFDPGTGLMVKPFQLEALARRVAQMAAQPSVQAAAVGAQVAAQVAARVTDI